MEGEQQIEIRETHGEGAPTEVVDTSEGQMEEHIEDLSTTEGNQAQEQLDGSMTISQPFISDNVDLQAPDVYEASPVASIQSGVSGVSGPSEEQAGSSMEEEPLTPATDNSSTSKSQPGSGRVTPASQSDQSLYMSSSEKGTPVRKRRSTDAGVRQIDFENQSNALVAPRNPRFPFRTGINWRKGEKLEAMDYLYKWFPAKIREINEEELTVLIHFDGWNQRFDEWVDMASDRIRPLIRHSERKDKSKRLKADHKIGEQVYAKWTDCKMYPAKITNILPNGSYEVIFYDGFKKLVQPINIRPMPGEMKAKTFEVSPVTASAPKKQKVRRESGTDPTFSDLTVPKSPPAQKARRDSKSRSRSGGRQRPKKNKVIPMDQFVAKETLIKDDGTGQTAVSISIKSEPVSTQTEYTEPKMEIKEELGASVNIVPTTGISVSQPYIPEPSDIKPAYHPTAVYGLPVLPPKAFVVESDHNHYKCHFESCNKGFRKEHLLEYHIKYYHIDGSDAPPPAPPKRRKKTTSVCSESDAPSSKKAKRPRQSSVEQFTMRDIQHEIKDEIDDSYLLAPIDKPKQETGEISTQTAYTKSSNVGEDVLDEFGTLHQRTMSQDSIVTEESSVTDIEEFLKPDELVNCICDFYEENGLMIQCEVCLCWQHASCFGITERTLPKTYVCFVCENPPGVRESSRYIHEQDWFKTGEMASFSYLPNPQQSEEKVNAIKQTHNLVAELHQLDSVMHSLKMQLKILKTKDEQKLKLWRMDWDVSETFNEEDDSPDISVEAHIQTDQNGINTTNSEDQTKVTFTLETAEENANQTAEENASNHREEENPNFTVGENAGNHTVDENAKNRTEENVTNHTADENVTNHVAEDNETNRTADENTTNQTTEEHTSNQTTEDSLPGVENTTNATGQVATHSNGGDNVTYDNDADVPGGSKEETITEKDTPLNNGQENTQPEKSYPEAEIVTKREEAKNEGTAEKNTEIGMAASDSANQILSPVPGDKSHEIEQEEANHSDSTESVVEDPTEMYERNLLSHIQRVQTEINDRMDKIEEQVDILESMEAASRGKETPPSKDVLADIPQLKKAMRTLHLDLFKVKKMAVFH